MIVGIKHRKTGRIKHMKANFAEILVKTKQYSYLEEDNKPVEVVKDKTEKVIEPETYNKKVIEEAPHKKDVEEVIIEKVEEIKEPVDEEKKEASEPEEPKSEKKKEGKKPGRKPKSEK